MAKPDETFKWHDDGHQIWLQIVRSDISVVTVICPHTNDDAAPCRSRQAPCVVQFFVDRFGLECNVGICTPSESIDVAWTLVGDPDDLDLAQVWVIPTTDDVFASWRTEQGPN